MTSDWRTTFWVGICWILAALMLSSMGCAAKGNVRRTPPAPWSENAAPSERAKPNHLALARQLIEKGYHDVARVQLEAAEKDKGQSAETRFLIGVCERGEGRLVRAEQAFRDTIRLDAGYAPAHDGLGVTLFALHRREEALEAFGHAVSLNPGEAHYQNNLGYAYLQEGRLLEAETCFRKSMTLMPGNTLAMNNMGFCLVKLGREAEALRVFRRALPAGAAYNNLGAAYERCGKRRQALAFYKKALRASPDLVQARENAARLERNFIGSNPEATRPEETEPR